MGACSSQLKHKRSGHRYEAAPREDHELVCVPPSSHASYNLPHIANTHDTHARQRTQSHARKNAKKKQTPKRDMRAREELCEAAKEALRNTKATA